MRQSRPGTLKDIIQKWESGRGAGKHFTAMKKLPAKKAVYGDFPENLDERIQKALDEKGIRSLYSHQSEAIESVLSGNNTVVVTPTASGKSFCYNLPVVDALYKGGHALYMFPTKALSQDQTAELNELLECLPDNEGWEAQVYDGDTPPDVRRRVRDRGKLIITNPDMLHAAILPHHAKWARFFKSLEYIIVDELHTYRGVFGSHVANVFRRLMRVCKHYGVKPKIIATSATIANPKELAETLTGNPFHLVTENGAPSSEKYVCLMNPPIKDVQQMRRQSSLSAAQRIATTVLKEECGTIVFTRSRQSVEVMINRLKERLKRDRGNGGLEERIASYRGGYLPDLRRRIEKGLRSGSILGVVSTNALELGIDIGSLDVCLLAGYPGTVASTWQQFGRAGRKQGTSVAILVASDDPLDQFIIRHPEYFFEQSPEAARIDPDNLRIVFEHLKCAVFELPWRHGEQYGGLAGEETQEVLSFLHRETGMIQPSADRWEWASRTYPATEINLRNIADENFVVIDISHAEPKVLAEVDFEAAHTTIYPNAVYQVSGEPYRVEKLDYKERRAYVRKSNDGYYTTAKHYAYVHVLDTFGERVEAPAEIGFGEVRVTDRFVGYKKIKFGTGENIGYGELDLPELDLHTVSYWVKLQDEHFPELSKDPEIWAATIAGLGQVLQTAASLKVMCDPRDLNITIGSLSEQRWLSSGYDGLTVHDDAEPGGKIGPMLNDPTIFIYDKFPGGVGFGEELYERHDKLCEIAFSLVSGCDCEKGCPSCVGPGHEGADLRKHVSLILSRLCLLN